MQAILLVKRNCIFSSFPKFTPISGLPIKNSFQMVQKKWANILSCRTWAASSSYTWSPFKKKPSLLRMRWGNIWKRSLSFVYGLRPWHLGFSLLRTWQKKQTTKMSIGITPVSAFLSGVSLPFLKGQLFFWINCWETFTFCMDFFKTCLKSINEDITGLCNLCVLHLHSPLFSKGHF